MLLRVNTKNDADSHVVKICFTTLELMRVQLYRYNASEYLNFTNEQEYDAAVERLNSLLDEIGEDQSHPLRNINLTISP